MRKRLDIALFCDIRNVHFQKWSAALQQRGHRVRIYSPWQDQQVGENVAVVSTPKAPLPLPAGFKALALAVMRWRHGRRIRKELRAEPPDLLHAHFLQDAGWIAAATGLHPLVVTAHGSDLLVLPAESRVAKTLARRVLRRSDCVVIVADHMRAALADYRIPGEKVMLVTSFIDTSIFYAAEKDNDRPVRTIASTRNFEPVYDVECLLRATAKLVARFPQIQLRLAGRGSQYSHLQRLAAALKIDGHVEFHGSLSQDEVADFLRGADLYVSTARSDGISVSALEAVACGSYPVLADIPGNRDLLARGIHGHLFRPGDEDDLAGKLSELVSTDDRLQDACAENAVIVQRQFGKDKVLADMEQVYSQLMS